MVREYIGARYVMKVYENTGDSSSAEWQSGVTYEPLTLVTYQGSSYLSKKNVPGTVGNPLANPSYWAVTGATNAQITNLTNRMTAVEQSAAEFKEIYTYKNRKFIFIGDSYMAGESIQGTIKSYTGYIKDYLGLTENVNFYVGAHSGYGFKNNGFKTLLGNVSNGISADDKLTITDIIVCGGINDASLAESDTATLVTNIGDFVAQAKYLFPNAAVKVAQISKDIDGRFHYNKASIETYKACTLFGAEYLTGSETILRRVNNFISDGHPNADGMKMLARYLTNCILNGSCSVAYYPIRCPISPDESITSIDYNNVIIASANGDNVFVDITSPMTVEFPSRSFQTADYVVAGTFTDGYIIGDETPRLIDVDGIVWINDTAERRRIKIAFSNRQLLLYPYDVLNILSNVTKIRILPGSYTFSTYDI